MIYPNLIEMIKYHPYHISTLADHAGVTTELMADICRSAILDLIGSSNDSEYLQAVYSFAEAYPHKVTDEKSVPPEEKHIQEIVDILREAGLKTQAEIYYFVREYCGRDGVKKRVGLADADGEDLEFICRLSKKLMR